MTKVHETHALHVYKHFCAEIQIVRYEDRRFGICIVFDYKPPRLEWDEDLQQYIPTMQHMEYLPNKFGTLIEARVYGDEILRMKLWDEHGLKRDL